MILIQKNKTPYSALLKRIFDENNQDFIWDRSAIDSAMEKIILFDQDEPVGYAIVYEGADFCEKEGYATAISGLSDDTIYIWQLVTRKGCENRGICRNILHFILERYFDREIYLCVDIANTKALRCYERSGFRSVALFSHVHNNRTGQYQLMKWMPHAGEY